MHNNNVASVIFLLLLHNNKYNMKEECGGGFGPIPIIHQRMYGSLVMFMSYNLTNICECPHNVITDFVNC